MINSDLWVNYRADDPRRSLPEEAVKYCITACYFSILWGQHHLMETVDYGARGEEECRRLRERLDAFMGLMRNFVSGETSNMVIKFFLIKIFKFNIVLDSNFYYLF